MTRDRVKGIELREQLNHPWKTTALPVDDLVAATQALHKVHGAWARASVSSSWRDCYPCQVYACRSLEAVQRPVGDDSCATCEEVEFHLHGGWDEDGPVQGLDGLDLPGVANVLHSMAVRAEMLESVLQRMVSVPGGISTVQFYANGKVQLILTPEGGDAFSEARALLDDALAERTQQQQAPSKREV